MDKYTYKALNYIKEAHTPTWTDVLNHFRPRRWVNRTDRLLRSALKDGLIEIIDHNAPPFCRVKLMPAGEKGIQEYQTCWRVHEIREWAALIISLISLILSIIALVSG